MNKFNAGERVTVISDRGDHRSGVIRSVVDSEEFAEYTVVLDGEKAERIYNECHLDNEYPAKEAFMEAGDQMDDEEFAIMYEMATVKWGFMSIKLAVFEGEGDGYPHFHFYKGCKPEGGITKEKAKGGGCICILSPNYFIHANHKDTMTPQEIEGLIKFLKQRHRTLDITNWEYIITLWNSDKSKDKEVPLDTPIPEYKSDMETIQSK